MDLEEQYMPWSSFLKFLPFFLFPLLNAILWSIVEKLQHRLLFGTVEKKKKKERTRVKY